MSVTRGAVRGNVRGGQKPNWRRRSSVGDERKRSNETGAWVEGWSVGLGCICVMIAGWASKQRRSRDCRGRKKGDKRKTAPSSVLDSPTALGIDEATTLSLEAISFRKSENHGDFDGRVKHGTRVEL